MTSKTDRTRKGEGDYEAAARYVRDKRAFVKSGKVDDALEHVSEQSPEEGRKARDKAAARAKEHDPQEKIDFDDAS